MKLTKEEKLESLSYSVERLTDELKHERMAVKRTRERLENLKEKIRELQTSEESAEVMG